MLDGPPGHREAFGEPPGLPIRSGSPVAAAPPTEQPSTSSSYFKGSARVSRSGRAGKWHAKAGYHAMVAQSEASRQWEQVFETKIASDAVKEEWNELKKKGAPEDEVLSSGGPATRWARARPKV